MVVAFVVEGISRLVHKTPHNDFWGGELFPILNAILNFIPFVGSRFASAGNSGREFCLILFEVFFDCGIFGYINTAPCENQPEFRIVHDPAFDVSSTGIGLQNFGGGFMRRDQFSVRFLINNKRSVVTSRNAAIDPFPTIIFKRFS